MNESDESIMKAMWDTADAAEKSQTTWTTNASIN